EFVTRILVDVAEVHYRDGGAWGEWADGGGSSLELTDVNADPWMGANWADSDESAKGEWTSVSVTGRLDLGNDSFPPDQLQITHQGGGVALVDEVEVVESGSSANLVSNPGFEASAAISGSGWTLQGNHATSSIQSGGAAAGDRCLRLQTQGRGDTGFNRIRTPLRTGLAAGDTATIRARVRWVRGWPEVLFRIRGNWLELPAPLTVPRHLGTPGAANSRRVDNAGPVLSEITHTPPLPSASEAVVVTARVADPDGVGAVRLAGRVDGGGTAVNLTLRDDGAGGDAFAGDGIYSATIPGRSSGNLVAFRIEATDGAAAPATTRFPPEAPARECLIRWGDTAPFGTLGHYHLWSTAATEAARNASSALNNLYRDATFIYGNSRVIYGAGFKDKGSPFKGGAGDWYVTLPKDEPLLNTDELAIVSTGNNGSDTTQLREQLCYTIARGIGASYLYRRHVRLYRNGSAFRDIMEDSEEPNGDYSERFYSQGERPDLYKIEDWFEFQDDGTSFSNVDATLQRFTTPPGVLKPARYRWNWRKRAVEESANNLTNLLELVTAVNTGGSAYLPRVLATVDVDQWMRTFAFQRIVGNWDSYGMGRGKNMYAYKRDGITWKLFSWDVDFALDAGGNGPTDGLWGAGDPVINTMFDTPTIRRRLWQAYRDAVQGPMDPVRATQEAESRADVLRNNGVPTAPHRGALDYIAARRQTILSAYQAADVAALEITSNGGNPVTTPGATVTVTGRAPLALTDLTVNGIPYPVTWTDVTTWRMVVPLGQATNDLVFAGVDRRGQPIPGYSDTLRVIATGALPQPEDHLVIHEIQYDAAAADASFLELHNTSGTAPFDLSGYRMDGVGFTFPTGALLPPGGYLVLARNRAGFAAAYGSGIAVFGEFPGSLDNDGERLALVRPDPTGGTNELIVDEVRYGSRFPWPTNAAGLGPSLQLVDPAQDNRRPGHWIATAVQASNLATPGAANAGRTTLLPCPPVWINEVLPENTSGPADNVGEREPFIELINRGTNTVDLAAFYLTDRESELTRWAFPAGTEIGPGGFLRVWADGQPGQTAPGHLHAGFRIAAGDGRVALVRRQGPANDPAVMDALEYAALSPNRSYGSFPDGDPLRRRLFEQVTPGATNDPAVSEIRVTINEVMAANAGALADPADGDFDDWFELHNGGTTAVDLSGYFLTDTLTDWNQARIPPGYVIPAGGFLLVWADNEPGQNAGGGGDLHVGFRLAAAGEQVGLFDPNGRMVDGVTFTDQADNTVVGRFPDGAGDTLLALDQPSPRQPNVLVGGNVPPSLAPIGPRLSTEMTLLRFTAFATDPDASQQLTFSLDPDAPPGAAVDPRTGAFSWTPSEAQGPGNFFVGIRVTDNGIPPRSDVERVLIQVAEANRQPILEPIPPVRIAEGTLLSLTVPSSDPDLPPQLLRYSLVNAPAGALMEESTGVLTWIPSEAQGPGTHALRIRVEDDGTPPQSTEQTLQVTVDEADAPPVIVQLPPASILEGGTLVVTNQASDSDTPPAVLRFSLPAGAPEGVTLDPATGVLRWPTTESDGPGSHLIVIRVTQGGSSPLSDQYTLGVTILEDNQPPTLSPIADLAVEEGALITFAAAG
ncbi:MAG: lamin tail domain-containing protein, partial [Verrucomicrobia bacterium]|nr:lamin tail domain-containing protein [Verrucomicrobiota bacterium]